MTTATALQARTLQVGVKAVIRDEEGRYLLLRKDKPFEMSSQVEWEIPGGRIDIGEATGDALRREIKEETGLDLVAIDCVLAAQDILINPALHVVRITYLVQATGTLVLNHSDHSSTTHDDFRWVTKQELQTLPLDRFLVDILPLLS